MVIPNQGSAGENDQPAPGDKKSRPRSVQNQAIANNITAAAELISRILANPAMIEALAKRGFDEAELKAGLRLQEKAQGGFDRRLSSLGARKTAKQQRDEALLAAREDFNDYRETVQARFDDPQIRAALGAAGKVSEDIQKFVTLAKAAYQAALDSEHTAWFVKRGYTKERLQEDIDALDDLIELQGSFESGKGHAGGATGERDEAARKLSAWVRELRVNATIALKDKPDLLLALGG